MAGFFARLAYTSLLRLLSPVLLLRLWWRGRAEPLYRQHLAERWGLYPAPAAGEAEADGPWVWLHAVSLGETRAAAALVAALRQRRPGMRLLLTHGTATGRAAGRELLQPGDHQCWLPYDLPGASRRFLRRFRPVVGVVMETEVWPSLLRSAQQLGVPMVLANARLSEKSQRQGRRFDLLLRPALASFRGVLAQTEADAQRLRQSGADAVRVAGNLKFDMAPDPALLARGRAWRQALGRPVLLAASFREGEESLLLTAWLAQREAALRQGLTLPLLLVVPRHPQRFDEVAGLLQASGLSWQRRSQWGPLQPGSGPEPAGPPGTTTGNVQGPPPAVVPQAVAAPDLLLGDSLGEMPLYYALADLALLGGSFAPLGGQNLIEAAACGCPVLMGPHTFNFLAAAEGALAAGAARRVDNMASAVTTALDLLQAASTPVLARQRQAALDFAAAHRGAAVRMAEQVLACC